MTQKDNNAQGFVPLSHPMGKIMARLERDQRLKEAQDQKKGGK